MLSDMVNGVSNPISKRDENSTALELHTSVISITSANPSAADAFNLIYKVLTINPSVILPYRFSSFLLNGVCSPTGEVCFRIRESAGEYLKRKKSENLMKFLAVFLRS